MEYIRRSFSDVFAAKSFDARSKTFATESLKHSSTEYTDVHGFHLYSQLSLTLTLTAPTNIDDASKAYEVIQRYVDIADACAQKAGGEILEVQGERLHFFFKKELTKETLSEIITFCAALTNAVYQQKHKLGGKAFNGFKICFDYGLAIILSTGDAPHDSFVSLGPCANNPAKHIPEVTAQCTAMPTEIAELMFNVDGRTSWYETNLMNYLEAGLENFSLHNFSSILSEGISAIDKEYATESFAVKTAVLREDTKGRLTASEALLYQGFFLRADLDGFTNKVQTAFAAKKSSTIKELLQDFTNVLEFGAEYVDKAPRPAIQLPWAGDCANILLLPKPFEHVDDAHTYFPAHGPSAWLTGYCGAIKPPYKEANWLVSLCGGDRLQGNRYVMLATVRTSSHDFLFAIGWSVGRSLDAHAVKGSSAGDTLISIQDHVALDERYQDLFTDANSNFKRSGRLHTIGRECEMAASAPTVAERTILNTPLVIPTARPHCCTEDF